MLNTERRWRRARVRSSGADIGVGAYIQKEHRPPLSLSLFTRFTLAQALARLVIHWKHAQYIAPYAHLSFSLSS